MRRLGEALSTDFDYAKAGKTGLLMRFWGNSAIYAVTSLITRLGTFLLLPIYWLRLAPEEFGLLAVSEMVTMGLTGVLTLCLEAALSRFYFEWPEAERPRQVASVWLSGSVASLALTLLAYLVASVAWDRLVRQVPFEPYIQLALAGALVRSFSNIPFSFLRVREELQRFTLFQFSTFFLSAGTGLYLVFLRGHGATGVLLGSIAGYLATSLFWVFYMSRRIQVASPFGLLAPSLRYCLPLVPTMALTLGVQLCDRYFLDRFAPLGLIGLYAVAGRFAAAVREVNTALKNSWIPFATRLFIQREDGPAVTARLANYYVAVLLTAGLAVALLSREFIEWLGPERYGGSYRYIPVLILAAVLEPLDLFAGLGLSLKNATRMVLLQALFEGILTLALVGTLTAKWGPMGTAWAILASRSAAMALHLAISLRICPIPYRFVQLFSMVLLACSLFGAATLLGDASFAVRIGLKILLLSAFVLTTAWFFLDLRHGLKTIRELFRPRAAGQP
jgi:O-antigen/teichoic acid export membrane protein